MLQKISRNRIISYNGHFIIIIIIINYLLSKFKLCVEQKILILKRTVQYFLAALFKFYIFLEKVCND
jgi:hypothetical protein